jgi:hypothetical protein
MKATLAPCLFNALKPFQYLVEKIGKLARFIAAFHGDTIGKPDPAEGQLPHRFLKNAGAKCCAVFGSVKADNLILAPNPESTTWEKAPDAINSIHDGKGSTKGPDKDQTGTRNLDEDLLHSPTRRKRLWSREYAHHDRTPKTSESMDWNCPNGVVNPQPLKQDLSKECDHSST